MIPATFVGMALALAARCSSRCCWRAPARWPSSCCRRSLLVFGATFGAAVAGSTMADLRRSSAPGSGWPSPPDRTPQTGALIAQLVELATLARKEGMLPLENRAARSRTRSCAAACSWPSTACRSSSCGGCSTARSRPPRRRPGGRALLRQDGRLRADRRHHRHRRRAGAGAARASRTRRCSARSSPAPSSRPCGACCRPTSSGCR